jgi:hypothetical protein
MMVAVRPTVLRRVAVLESLRATGAVQAVAPMPVRAACVAVVVVVVVVAVAVAAAQRRVAGLVQADTLRLGQRPDRSHRDQRGR